MSGGITNFNSFPPPFYLALRKLQSNFLCRVESQISILSHHLFISRYENCRAIFYVGWNHKFQFFPTTFLSRVTKIAEQFSMSGGITNFNSFPPPFYLALRKLQMQFSMSGGIINFNSFPLPFYLALRKLQM